jgi:predicted ATPase/class 3 adenylate cyclase
MSKADSVPDAPAPALPSGTVTLLFTDIEGSTQLLARLRDRYGDLLAEHHRLLGEAFAAHGGRVVDTQGDAFLVAFAGAGDAVRAAAAGQRALAAALWPDGTQLGVRMGLHTGEPTVAGERYVGMDVHRGARIAAAAHGGQVLLSQTTRELLSNEVEVDDLGEHRLKDLSEPQRLYQLVGEGLRRTFPPLTTLAATPNNLPPQSTRLVGRTQELASVCALLRRDDVRLLTLTGAGGSGKTRLALQVAADALGDFQHGAFFVPLAAVTDPSLVVPAVEQAFGLGDMQTLEGYLREKRLLLLLDNFEQVLDASSSVAELLARAPHVKALVTSRATLRLSIEHVYPVAPLPERDAVTLFVERAQAVKPDFELTADDEPSVRAICGRVDGLPLAVELAAARIMLLTPEAMLTRLDERLKLLTAGARDLPARQQTLRDTIDWSHELLSEEERALFAGLAVFSGGFTLEAAEAVCAADLETIGSLLEKSLLRQDAGRFGMLDTIREYALDRLGESGEETGVRDRHAEYFLVRAEEMYPRRWEREAELAAELELEHDNLRAALAWLRRVDPERHLRLASALGWFWRVHSHYAEGGERLADALRLYPGEGLARARALLAAGEVAGIAGDRDQALAYLEEAEQLFRAAGELEEVAAALEHRGWAHFMVGEADAVACMERALEVRKDLGDPYLINRAEVNLLHALITTGAVDVVEPRCEEVLARAEALGDTRAAHHVNHFFADCALMQGDYDAAEERYRVALELAIELGDQGRMAGEMQGIAMAAAGRSRAVRALRLAAASYRKFQELGIDISVVAWWVELLDRHFGQAREELGEEAAVRAWEEGEAMSWEAALEYARDLAAD